MTKTMKKILSFTLFLLFSSNVAFSGERIISLKPNITEILFALGVGGQVVGVTTWCDYPEAAKKLPKVADYININTERIMALKPDLVIGSEENSVKSQFAALNSAGIRTMTAPFATIEDLYGSIGKIAEAVGKKDAGKKLVAEIRKGMKKTNPPSPPFTKGGISTSPPFEKGGTGGISDQRTVLILVGHRPLVAASDKTFMGEIVGLAGFKNVVTSERLYPTINTEFLLAKNPDVIIDLGMGSEAHSELPAALRGRVVKLDISDFRAGPRIGEAVKKLSVVMGESETSARP